MLHINRIVTRLCLAFVFAAGSLGAATPLGAAAPGTIAPATQGAAVLVGLRPGTSLRVDGHGVSASDSGLAQSVSALGVQSADTVFHAVRGDGQLSLPGLASAIDLRSVYKLRLPAGANLAAALAALRADPAVVYAEPDAVAHLITTPNDPLYPQQWGLAQIGAPTAWSTTTGSASVAIAVIDSGIDATHPDLAGQLWTNPGEIAGNGLDDDNDGYVDDMHGWNILNNNADLSDTSGHGTEVAGIAAAASNNGAGVAGVSWACKLMVVKVAQPSGVANYSDIAAGVAYAALKGARVINLSLGGASDSITLRAAVTAAAATAVVVGGAGNSNSNAPFYPAAYPEALAVAGTTNTDTKVADSNFGAWVDVAAPGEAITTTFSGGTYGSSSGTSLAAPFAAGLAGLLFSQHPDWSAAQVRAQIVHTAHNIDAQNPGYAGQLGSGRIDAASAVATTAHPVVTVQSISINGQANGTPDPGAQANVSVTLYDDWAPASNLQATLTGGGPNASVISGSVSYGTLGTYQSAANSGTFRINVASAAGYGASLPFTLNLTADGGFAASLPVNINTPPSLTTKHGTLNTQTWTNNRAYVIDNNATVPAGQVLTIQPGTIVQFAGNFNLSIAGTLIADGTAQQPIRFTRYMTSTNWNSIEFLDSSVDATFDANGNYTGGSIIRHAVIDGWSNGGIDLASAAP
jgi:subtilisin family serine protease